MPRLLIFIFLFGGLGSIFAQTASKQFQYAPSDPNFLYEKRFIPGNEKVESIEISPVEDINEKEDQSNNKPSINLTENLPNLTQSLVIIAVLVIFVLYRMQVKKKQSLRRRR